MERVEFTSGSLACVGHWHWPADRKQPMPVIVMGHGFCAEWNFGTADIIAGYTQSGYAVFTFDYRGFGESQGEPRQWLDIDRELEDWHSALAHVRANTRVDPGRLVIWGSSLGGGHALSIAARDHDVAAVLAQVPHCDKRAAAPNISKLSLLKTLPHVLLDWIAARRGEVHTIPIVAEPGQAGALAFPGWKADYLRLVPESSNWRNALPARSVPGMANYSPIETAVNIRCPVHICYATDDLGVPPTSVEKTAARIEKVETYLFKGDHFDVYFGECQVECMNRQLDFLSRVL